MTLRSTDSQSVQLTAVEPFGVFFQREFHTMVTLAQAVSGDPSTGEDIAAEAMLRASKAWQKVGSYDRPGAWVRRVTINLASNRRRKIGRERNYLRRQKRELAIVAPVEHPNEALWAAVASLPPKQRAAIALRYLDDMSVADMAEVLECSESTVTSHLHKARTNLANALEKGAQR